MPDEIVSPEVSTGAGGNGRPSAAIGALTGLLGLLALFMVMLFCLVVMGWVSWGGTGMWFLPATPTPTETLLPVLRHTSTVTMSPVENTTPTLTLSPTPTEIVPYVPAPTEKLPFSEQGSRLLIRASDGLWVMAMDASWMARLSEVPVLAPLDLKRAVAPFGGHIAYVANRDQPVLNVVHLSEATSKLGLPLSPLRATISTANRQALAGEALAWSPDGRSLAFTGLQEGLRASLYLYSLDSGSVTRLSDGQRYAFRPHWSPDGGLIIYFESDTMGEGEPITVMAVAPSSGERRSLYEVSDSLAEVIVGWGLGGDRFLVYSRKADCEVADLRLVRTESGVAEPFNIGCISAVAIQPDTGSILYVSDESKNQPGVFLLPAGLGNPRPLRGGAADDVRWVSMARLFFVHDSSGWARAFSSDGLVADIPAVVRGLLPEVSAVSGLWAWATEKDELPGLWISAPEVAPRKVFAAPASFPCWGADGQTLFFLHRNDLYVAYGPRFDPNLLASFPPGAVEAVWAGQ